MAGGGNYWKTPKQPNLVDQREKETRVFCFLDLEESSRSRSLVQDIVSMVGIVQMGNVDKGFTMDR